MSLKEFCVALQQCANKLEEEIKFNINDIHNLVYSNQLNETKMALEKAKDYHYKEILDSIGEILKSVKKILFHQDKIEWLNNENNFTKDELRRFSYVKRQVYAFSNNEQAIPVSTPSIKKEIRRTTSEVSIGTLEAWEKYLDQKDEEEKQIEETISESKPQVPKRTLSNARRRKKFVSSTLGGFLENDEMRRNLDSIFEDASSTEENERSSYSKSLESLDKMALNIEQNIHSSEISGESRGKDYTKARPNASLRGSLECLYNMTCDNEIGSMDISKNLEDAKHITDKKTDSLSNSSNSLDKVLFDAELISDVMKSMNESIPNDENRIKNELIKTFLDETSPSSSNDTTNNHVEESVREKPKIVDVIYKKKPS